MTNIKKDLPSSRDIKKSVNQAIDRIRGDLRESKGLSREFNTDDIEIPDF